MDAICKECMSVDKMCPRTEISCIPLGNKGFVLNGNSVPKNKFSMTTHQLSITDVKMLPLTGKIGNAYKVRKFFS